jgi:iron uptake system component EfeO
MVEAAFFKYSLCKRLVADSEALEAGIAVLPLDSPNAYESGTKLIEGQLAKMKAAGEGMDESRYAGFSLADLRENLAAAQENHAIFRGWLRGKDRGVHVDGEISGGFSSLSQAFAAVSGDALPEAPAGWSSVDPTEAMRATPFGAIFLAVSGAANSTVDGSLTHSMDEAADLLGISGATPPPTTAKPTHDSDDI